MNVLQTEKGMKVGNGKVKQNIESLTNVHNQSIKIQSINQSSCFRQDGYKRNNGQAYTQL